MQVSDQILRSIALPEGIQLFECGDSATFSTPEWVGTTRKVAYLIADVGGQRYRQAFEVWAGQEEPLLRKALAEFETNLKGVSTCTT